MSDINPYELIDLFKKALAEKWGYIGGKSGQLWTENAQSAAEREFRNGNQDYEGAAKFGRKWIGHRVSDCSGMFQWAFKELGGYMYHGQNTMWSKYSVNKGKLVNGARDDGQTLKPGTAVYKVNGTDYYHVGLFVGGKTVIEARGTQAGVTTSEITRWNAWGELKGVDYTAKRSDATVVKQPESAQNVTTPVETVTAAATATIQAAQAAITRSDVPMNTTNAVVIANGGVNMRSEPSTTATKITTIPKDAMLKATPYDDAWSTAEYNGKTGYVMTKYIQINNNGSATVLTEEMQIIANIERELARLKILIGQR